MNRLNLMKKPEFTLDDQMEAACLISVGSSCRCLELLALAFNAYRIEEQKVETLREWIKTLDRQKKYNERTKTGLIFSDLR